MPRAPIRTVAVVGGGPAGATLATYLARAGVHVALFTRTKQTPLVIGESLVPAIVPFLRDLGIEDEVRSFSVLKPGATWIFEPDGRLSFNFRNVRKAMTTYSYNSPRDLFDAAVLGAAARAGARVVDATVRLERDAAGARVRLGDAALAATGGFLAREPDLVVDASGRARLIASLLRLPTEHGPRRDAALFAHLAGVPTETPGHIVTNRLAHGWCWRIPLPGRVSVGLVVPGDELARFGATVEEQYDACVRTDPWIRDWGAAAERLTPVAKYSNYQLITRRGVGDGWALLGDAFGFVDPVFSSGLLLAMDGARVLADTILAGTPAAFRRYERHVIRHIHAWQQAVGYYYDGRLFTLMRIGERNTRTFIGRLINPHLNTHLPRVFTGESTTKRYSFGLLNAMCAHALGNDDPSRLAIR